MKPSEEYAGIRNGSLLISEPWSDAPYFDRSVVLIVEHTPQGDVGFILNKCVDIDIFDLVENFPEVSFPLCLGGPVAPSTLHYIHNLGDVLVPGSLHVAGNIYWGGDFNIITALIGAGDADQGNIKFFIGYSGWSEGQLESEFLSGAWGAASSHGLDIIGKTDNLWYDVVQSTSDYCHWALLPENPSDN